MDDNNRADHSYASNFKRTPSSKQHFPGAMLQDLATVVVIKQERVENTTESCQKCVYYDEELRKTRELESALEVKCTELDRVRRELRNGRNERKDNRLKAALIEAISARDDQRKAEEKASRNSSLVQKLEQEIQELRFQNDRKTLVQGKTETNMRNLQEENKILREENASRNLKLEHVRNRQQEEIQVLRKENENLLKTLQDNFAAHSKTTIHNIQSAVGTPNKYQQRQSSRSVSNHDLENGGLHCQMPILDCIGYNVEDKQSDEDDSISDLKLWESEDDDVDEDVIFVDAKDTNLNGSLEAEDYVADEKEELDHKVCLWLEPDQEPCHEIVRTVQELKAHIRNEHLAENMKLLCMWQNCAHKSKTFKMRCGLITHMNTHIGEANLPTFPCRFAGCEMVFVEQSGLDNHLVVHFEKSPPPLRHFASDKSCDSRSDVTEHKENDSMQKYFCRFPACGKAYSHAWSATRHEKKVHKEMKKYHCQFPQCGMNFTSDNELKRHEQAGHTSCPDQASIDGKNVSSEKAHSHDADRSDQSLFQCDFPGCNRIFDRQYGLIRHNAIHASGKHFSCSNCIRMFAAKHELENHEVGCHDRPVIYCAYKDCRKSYSTQSDLAHHEKSHVESARRQLYISTNKYSARKKPRRLEPRNSHGNLNFAQNSNYVNGKDSCGSPLNMQATPHERMSGYTRSMTRSHSSCSGDRSKRKRYYM